MQTLARRHDARMVFENDETLGHVDAGLPTPFSVFQEWAELGLDLTAAVLRGGAVARSRPAA